ncbi:unnamed protein product, partial [Ixodes hexagonus]
ETRQVVLNVYCKLRTEYPSESYREIVRRTSELTGVGYSTIFRWKKLVQPGTSPGVPSVPSPLRTKQKAVPPSSALDSFHHQALWLIVHDFFRRNEFPTLSKAGPLFANLSRYNKTIARITLWRVLKKLGFTFTKHQRDSVLMERMDLVLWRAKYLRATKKHRLDNKSILPR